MVWPPLLEFACLDDPEIQSVYKNYLSRHLFSFLSLLGFDPT
jgi:hypothetical protein